ncbi:alpha-2-macroglobulin family protein [bacterium]|nr:alpha-2-macroglobulin family protein [bacterium]
MNHYIKVVILISLILALISGCEKTGQPSVFSAEAKIITHKTAGFISPTGEIAVRFVEDMVDSSRVGVAMKSPVFEFSPNIDGVTRWVDRRTIALKPSRSLDIETQYEGFLDLEALFPTLKMKTEHIEIEFGTYGLDISELKADFVLIDENDPTRFIFDGKLLFNMATDSVEVIQSIGLWEGKKRVELAVTPDTNGGYIFHSELIERTDEDRRFTLEISSKKLKLPSDFAKEYLLPSKVNFVVTSVEIAEDEAESSIEIFFSDKLNSSIDYRGFIRTEPSVDVRVSVRGKSIVVRGDFKRGSAYVIEVVKGLRSKWGAKVALSTRNKVEFPSLLPQVKFVSNGLYIPSTNKKSIDLNSVNVRRMIVSIKKVYENNLGFFIQENYFNDNSHRRWGYNDMYRVGEVIAVDTLEICDIRDKWFKSRLDLSKIASSVDKGAFIIELSFDEDDILVSMPEDWARWRKNSYFWDQGRISTAIIFTDIGLIAKNTGDKIAVWALDLVTAEPIIGANITLKSYVNQPIANKVSDSRGYCEFDTNEGFSIEGEFKGQRTVLIFRDMGLNTSLFDVGGSVESTDEIRAFIYTERGVYRPGDTVHISAIIRNGQGTFPKNHPLEFELYNPRNRKVFGRALRKADDGFYSLDFNTEQDAPTGFWRAEFLVGEKKFTRSIRIETVVPYRIKAKIQSESTHITAMDRVLRAAVQANYLFGNPAAGLKAEVALSIRPFELEFDKFEDFVFTNEIMEFEPVNLRTHDIRLASDGKALVKWDIPEVDAVPSALTVEVSADVFEKGGRAVPASQKIPFEVYSRYIGIKSPEGNFVRVGSTAHFEVVLVDNEGKILSGNTLSYKIYKSHKYWWFDYETIEDYRRHYKSDVATEQIAEGTVITESIPAKIEWTPNSYGTVFLEVSDETGGHVAGIFINARHWGREPSGGDADLLSVKIDREKYKPGETATIITQTPKEGRALLSIEAGRRIVFSKWYDLNSEESVFEIPITKDMIPTAYATITVIQPHENTENDVPMRLYGVISIPVELEETRLDMEISAPEEIEPGQKFSVSISSKDKSPYQYTIAVVDEGLLDITSFQTPDPWGFFYRRMALLVSTFDVYSHVVGANWGEIFKRFSIGGGIGDYDMQKTLVQTRRFKAVSLFNGVGQSDKNGKAKTEFIMPEYVGAVRIMLVAVKGKRYGSAEKTVLVKAPLMVLPTLPRVLAPGDEIALPVSIFAMEKNLGKTTIELSAAGPVSVVGEKKIVLDMQEITEKDIVFQLKADDSIGVAVIKVSAKSSSYRIADETEIAVRPSNPWVHTSKTKVVSAGQSAKFNIPGDGVTGTNHARLTVNKLADLNLTRRLEWLIAYPYGCIEQTVSSAFPQIYLPKLAKLSKARKKEIDENINAAIERLRKFQLPSGGYGYWPNSGESSAWASCYAGHFMTEAKEHGYFVPEDMFEKWRRFEKDASRGDPENVLTQAYRLYILSKAHMPQLGAMNLLRQNYFDKMDNASRWLLALAYLNNGADKTAKDIIAKTGTDIRTYREMSWTYGSSLRDKAIMLEGLVQFGRESDAFKMYQDIATELASDKWLSTQETAFSLRSAALFMQKYAGKSDPIEGMITLPDEEKIQIDGNNPSFMLEIEEGFGEELAVDITSGKSFVTMSWFGVPLKDTLSFLQNNLSIKVEWLNQDGIPINAASLVQNTIFWEHIRVVNPTNIQLSELALTQMLPSGWEIENIRLSGENYPDWSENYNFIYEDYFDIRDDRASWFFDMRGNSHADFLLKLNTVTVGSFHLPPTQAEVMYDNRYQARIRGRDVTVLK